jgi:hypothetical protein
MNESEKQFSFTRAAPSTSGHAKYQIPISNTLEKLTELMATKSNAELIAMFSDPQDWTPEALDAAKVELHRRGLDPEKHSQNVSKPVTPFVPTTRGPRSFNGIGTTYYGKRDFKKDETYITTEWHVFFWIPLIPIRSLRVKYIGHSEGDFVSSEQYLVSERTRPNRRQVAYIYSYVVGMFGWVVVCNCLLQPHETFVFASILLLTPLPWILRRNARRKTLC